MHDGMTQAEIARKCRTQQSQVSDWANGKRKAPEAALAPLIEVYGHKINRTSARVYLVHQAPPVPWDETDVGRRFLEAQEQLKAVPTEPSEPREAAESKFWSQLEELGVPRRRRHHLEHTEGLLRAEYVEGPASFGVVRVEGRVLFRHTFEVATKAISRGDREPRIRWVPVRRWAVHAQRADALRLVRSELRGLPGMAAHRWRNQREKVLKPAFGSDHGRFDHLPIDVPIHSRDDAGRWLAKIEERLDVPGLLELTDTLLNDEGDHDHHVVPFLLRKALVEAGYDVPGLRTLPASP